MHLADGTLLARRHRRLRLLLEQAGLDGLLVTHLPNLRYLTNFVGSTGLGVVTRDALWLVTDFRYVTPVEALLASPQGPPATTLVRVGRSYDEDTADLLNGLKLARLGFEADRLTVARHQRFARTVAPTELVPTERLVERGREVKDEFEIAAFRKGAALVSEVATIIGREALAGRSERAIAARIDGALREAGFERPAFETIVASGPNAAVPHAQPGDRALQPSEPVVLDFGGVYDGYCVDLTRTLCVGAVDQTLTRVHAAVLDAQRAAIAAVRPGVAASSVDAAARNALEKHGLAEAFGHSTGHGLGLEIHEDPRIARRREDGDGSADTILGPGMVFTIEPGCYLAGWGGVRIEDDVLVTPEGCEVLTSAPRDPGLGAG